MKSPPYGRVASLTAIIKGGHLSVPIFVSTVPFFKDLPQLDGKAKASTNLGKRGFFSLILPIFGEHLQNGVGRFFRLLTFKESLDFEEVKSRISFWIKGDAKTFMDPLSHILP